MTDSDILWFVMRDLTHYHSKSPAYKMLDGLKIENFTPKVQKLVVRGGKRERIEVPFIHDLIFVHDSRLNIDPIVEKVPTFQYRFLRDGKRTPMTVREADMERFKKAVEVTDNHYFYTPPRGEAGYDRQESAYCRRSVGRLRRKSAKNARLAGEATVCRTA